MPSVGPGADPGVQAVSPQMTISHPPGGRLPLLSARPAVTFPAAEHRRPLVGISFYRPTEGRRLSRSGWLVTHRNKVPSAASGSRTRTRSPIPVYMPMGTFRKLQLEPHLSLGSKIHYLSSSLLYCVSK